MTVIVESGATKSDWRVIDGKGVQIDRRLHPGMNVSSMPLPHIKDVLASGMTALGELDSASFFMYTAGVVTDDIRDELTDFILSSGKFVESDIQNDLMGAARSVLGHGSGIAAIMGTGSNTCFYDGKNLTQKVYSGGFILGDDGSAASLGRMFLTDFIKGRIPSDVAEDFASKFDASYSGIVGNVYRSQTPSLYLGSLSPFIVSHYDDPHIKSLVDCNFSRFIEYSLKQYDTAKYPLGIVGGFGYACRSIFAPMCESEGIKITSFIPEPVEGLIKYHINPVKE